MFGTEKVTSWHILWVLLCWVAGRLTPVSSSPTRTPDAASYTCLLSHPNMSLSDTVPGCLEHKTFFKTYPVADLIGNVANTLHCQSECRAKAGFKFFSYNTDTRVCFLLKDVKARSSSMAVTSGQAYCVQGMPSAFDIWPFERPCLTVWEAKFGPLRGQVWPFERPHLAPFDNVSVWAFPRHCLGFESGNCLCRVRCEKGSNPTAAKLAEYLSLLENGNEVPFRSLTTERN